MSWRWCWWLVRRWLQASVLLSWTMGGSCCDVKDICPLFLFSFIFFVFFLVFASAPLWFYVVLVSLSFFFMSLFLCFNSFAFFSFFFSFSLLSLLFSPLCFSFCFSQVYPLFFAFSQFIVPSFFFSILSPFKISVNFPLSLFSFPFPFVPSRFFPFLSFFTLHSPSMSCLFFFLCFFLDVSSSLFSFFPPLV